MSVSLLNRILRYVEWGKPTLHVTGKGKSKLIATGIPSQYFWQYWKQYKEELKLQGISLRFYGEGKKKQWEVICWHPGIINY